MSVNTFLPSFKQSCAEAVNIKWHMIAASNEKLVDLFRLMNDFLKQFLNEK